MSDVIARWAEDPFLTLSVLCIMVGLVFGIAKRSGVPAFVGLVCAITLFWGHRIVKHMVQAGQ